MIGSGDYRRAMLERFEATVSARPESSREARAFREASWERAAAEALREAGIAEDRLRESRKGAEWKVAIARRLRQETTATNTWVADRLHMGHATRVSNLVHGNGRGPASEV